MIIGAMRVKNEERWIAESVRSILPVCSEVFVMDDHSTDRTAIRATQEGAFVFGSPFSTLDEARDKNYLIRVIMSRHGQGNYWVLMIDGDEILPGTDCERLRAIALPPGCPDWPPSLTFRILYLWDRSDQIRVDGVYANMTRPSLFDSSRTNMIFRTTAAGGSFHCGNVPSDLRGLGAPSGAALLHLGYLERLDRVRKYAWYNDHDPNNEAEDRYRHMVIGDLFPPETVLRHGGPLKLESLVLP